MLGRLSLSLLLLMNERKFPWLILVPERPDKEEIYHLDFGDRQKLLEESCYLSESLVTLFNPDKINIATLGNIVPQLHMHHIVRYKNDKAWPGPVWGNYLPEAYTETELNAIISQIKKQLTRLREA